MKGNENVAVLFEETSPNVSVSNNIPTDSMYLESVQIVRVKNGTREILNTIKVKFGENPTQRIRQCAERFSKFGAVMVVEHYERVAMQFDHNPNLNIEGEDFRRGVRGMA